MCLNISFLEAETAQKQVFVLFAIGIIPAGAAEVEERLRPQDLCIVLGAVAVGLGAQSPKRIRVLVLAGVVLDSGLADPARGAPVVRGEVAGTHGGGCVRLLMHPRAVDVATEQRQRRCSSQPGEQ